MIYADFRHYEMTTDFSLKLSNIVEHTKTVSIVSFLSKKKKDMCTDCMQHSL